LRSVGETAEGPLQHLAHQHYARYGRYEPIALSPAPTAHPHGSASSPRTDAHTSGPGVAARPISSRRSRGIRVGLRAGLGQLTGEISSLYEGMSPWGSPTGGQRDVTSQVQATREDMMPQRSSRSARTVAGSRSLLVGARLLACGNDGGMPARATSRLIPANRRVSDAGGHRSAPRGARRGTAAHFGRVQVSRENG
jgi:hypothetical protein